MTTIHVDRFLGIAPKLGPELLAKNNAQIAKDAKLWSEKLRPLDGLGEPTALSKTGNIQTIYEHNDVWLHWNEDVNVARGAIATDEIGKLYFTGDGKPKVTTAALAPAAYTLGLPHPGVAPVATDDAAGNVTGDFDYVFTYARKWSDGTVDEGPPSAVSNFLTGIVDRQISVTLPDAPGFDPAEFGITHKRLYRLAGIERYMVKEVPVATVVTIDNVNTTQLGAALDSTSYLAPPDDMIGLIELPNGLMAGFSGQTVLLCEPYRPWAWPPQNRYTVNWPVKAIGAVGTSIVAATTSHPYVGRGVDPAAYTFKRDAGRYPCASKRSMASGDLGAIWATPNGLAAFDGTSIFLATKQFLSRREWLRDFFPKTLHAVVHDGRYYAWFRKRYDAEGNPVGGGLVLDWSERAFLTTLSEYQYAAYSIPDEDALWVARKLGPAPNNNVVVMFEGQPALPFNYQWKSKVFITPGLENFGWCQIIGDYDAGLSPAEIAALEKKIADAIAYNQQIQGELGGSINGGCGMLNNVAVNGDCRMQTIPSDAYIVGAILFKYWADRKLKLQRDVTSNEPFPLPSGFRAEIHEFELNGAVQTTQVTLSTSVEELAST
jgi:hypothetical protein